MLLDAEGTELEIASAVCVDTVGLEIRRFGKYIDDPRKSTMYRPIRDATGAGDLQDCWPVTAC